MNNVHFRTQILALIGDEGVEGIVLGDDPDSRYEWDKPKPKWHSKLIPLEKALKICDYFYNNGFGGAECHPFYIWTHTKIIFCTEYDGATGFMSIPRNPVDVEPTFA